MAQTPIFINPAELAGVDDATYAAADAGDRQAQKLMLRGLMTRDASPTALISGHWTDWMLRMVATGAHQAVCDTLGAVAEAARQGEISASQQQALDELVEQHFGPGTVPGATGDRAVAAFAGEKRPVGVLRLFLLADRLADGDPTVERDEVLAAIERAEALDAPGASAFFRAVWAQQTYGEDVVAAFGAALDALKILEPLAENDPPYQTKLGQLALLCSQLADIAGDANAATLLRAAFAERIDQFHRSQEEG